VEVPVVKIFLGKNMFFIQKAEVVQKSSQVLNLKKKWKTRVIKIASLSL